MTRSFRFELSKIGRWPAAWVLLTIWAVLAIAYGYLTPYLAYLSPAAGVTVQQLRAALAGMLPAAIAGKEIPGYPIFGGVIALALGALTAGSEFGWGTWTTVLLQDPDRIRVAAGKQAALFVVVALQVAAGFGVAGLSSIVVALLQQQPVVAPPVGDLLTGMGAAWLILMTWAALGAMLATLLRSTALPLGIGFAYLLVEVLVTSLAGRSDLIAGVARLLPATNAGSLASSVLPAGSAASGPGMNSLVPGWIAAAVLIAYVMAASALTGAVTARRDVA